jgi:FCD domain
MMTKAALMMIQSALARSACVKATGHDLKDLQASVERASALPPGVGWERKAATHAEFHCVLADATGNPVFAILARCISGSVHDMIVAAGPQAEDHILASYHRLLARLVARDADGAAREAEDCLTRLGGADINPLPASLGNYPTVAAAVIRPRWAPARSGRRQRDGTLRSRCPVQAFRRARLPRSQRPARSRLAGGQDYC